MSLKPPEPEHPLGQMTTAELNAYEAELERLVRVPLADSVYRVVTGKLADIAKERDSRTSIRKPRGWLIF